MVKLAVIADDLTGALDTGIKFSKKGICTQVFTGCPVPFHEISGNTEAIIVDTETRHRDKDTAHKLVYDLVTDCVRHGIQTYYKKTDSALRGHIGGELAALHKALNKPVRFIPALPEEDRYTDQGIHYIQGTPVSESIFGSDPFNPVSCSRVSDLIGTETDVKTAEVPLSGAPASDAGIMIYDGRSNEDLEGIGAGLQRDNALDATAGCAGFARVLADHLDFACKDAVTFQKQKKLIVISGSINEVSGKQLEYAEKNGFFRHSLSAEEKLDESFLEREEGRAFLKQLIEECSSSDRMIIDVYGPDVIEDTRAYALAHDIPAHTIPGRIALRLGEIFSEIAKANPDAFIMIIGGDTLIASIKQFPDLALKPVCEPAPGTVMVRGITRDQNLSLLSKSGGFGEKDLLIDLANQLTNGGM